MSPVAPNRSPLARRARRASGRTLAQSQALYPPPIKAPAAPMAGPGGRMPAPLGMGRPQNPRPMLPGGRGGGIGGMVRRTAGMLPQPPAEAPAYDDAEDTFLNRFERYAEDPMDRIRGMAGYDDLTSLQGSQALYSALADEGISNAGSAGRRSRTAAQARGLHGQGVSYASIAGDAERDAYSGMNDAMLGARSSSISGNRDFLQALISGQGDWLRQLYQDRERGLTGLAGQERQNEWNAKLKPKEKRNPIGVTTPVGGVSF